MRNLVLSLVVAVSIIFGINTVNASEVNNNNVVTESTNQQIKVRQYEDGAIWVYVYSEDGAFITKYVEAN